MMPNDPVQKSFVNLSLMGGLNKKKDTHQLQNGELLTADNVVFTAVEGQVTKRYGFQAVQPQGAPFQGGPFKALGVRDNVEPLILGANTLNKYNATQNLSTAIPTPTQARLDSSQCVGSSGQGLFAYPPSHPSCATDGSSYTCLTWEEPNASGAFMFYGVQDLANGNWIIPPTQIQNKTANYSYNGVTYTFTNMHSPRVTYYAGQFYVMFVWFGTGSNAGTTVYQAFVTLQLLNLTNLAAGLVNGNYYQVIPNGNSIAQSTSPTNVSYDFTINASNGSCILAMTNVGTSTVTWYTGTAYNTGNITMAATNSRDTGGCINTRVAVKADAPLPNRYCIGHSAGFFVIRSDGVYVNSAAAAFGNQARFPVDVIYISSGIYGVLTYDNSQTRSQINLLVYDFNTSRTSGVLWNPPIASAYVQILSRLFTIAQNSKIYAWIAGAGMTSDSIYNAAYLVEFDLSNSTSAIVARTLYLTATHITQGDVLFPCEVVKVPNTSKYVTFLVAATEKVDITSARNFGTLNRVAIDFAPNRSVQILPLATGGNLIAGSYPLYYDGNVVCEAGFSAAPTGTPMYNTASITNANTPVVTSAGSGLAGGASTITLSGSIEYYYVICLVRRDAYGNVLRSAPSPVITVPAPNAFQSVLFPAVSYNGGGNVMVEYYRSTQNIPGTFYFLRQIPVGQTFNDTVNDGSTAPSSNNSITKNRTIYTNANELPNDPPPPIHHAVASESRVYCIPADNRNLVWYSKQFSPGRTVEWSASLTLSEGLNSGQFVGLAILDSNLIIFKADQVLYTYGNGPDNTGANGSFAAFTRIASDVGCVDPGSITVIPDGVVFKSRRGIEMLTRALQIVYIGSDVEPLVQTSGPIATVVTIPNFTETRFVPSTPGKPVLCYDYSGKRWSTFSNMAAVQAASIFGNYWFISADGTLVNQETPDQYTDNGTPIVMTLETPEIPVGSAGAQGWGRAYRMALLGDFFNDFVMTVQFAYDHSNTYTNAVQFSTATGLINGDKVFQFRTSRLPRQVMQTLRLKIQDNGTSGQACAISNIALEVGSKNGLAKLADQKTL